MMNKEVMRSKPDGKPLTIEQLREMGGQPVWVKCLNNKKYTSPPVGWRILEKSITGHFGVWDGDNCLAERDYNTDWLAYAYPPAHIDRDAWEPCEWCEDFGDYRYKLYVGYCMQKAADDTYEEETEKLNYCPKCGRPLTEEAWAMLEKRLRG